MQPRTVGGWTNPDGSINDPAETMRKHQDAIAKLQKAMSAAKTQTQKDAIQKRMVTRKQWLANLKKRLTGK